VRILRMFSKMLAVLGFVSISDWKMQKSLKTDYENLVHVYLSVILFKEKVPPTGGR
jgi:hypothetical protein